MIKGLSQNLSTMGSMNKQPSPSNWLNSHLYGARKCLRKFFADSLAGRGYAVDHWQVNPQEATNFPDFSPARSSFEREWNVVGTHRRRESTGRSLIINGHIDVVLSGPEDLWIMPLFEPYIDQGWLYESGVGI